jgi:hypothetical protein
MVSKLVYLVKISVSLPDSYSTSYAYSGDHKTLDPSNNMIVHSDPS